MLMPNTRVSIVKLSGSMKRKKHILLGTPRKIIASPALTEVLRRLDAKDARQSAGKNEDKLANGQ